MNNREKRTSPLTIAGDALLLIFALTGVTASFLSLYGDRLLGETGAFQATPLDLCAAQWDTFFSLAVVLALAALAVWSLPRFQLAAAGGLALLLGLLTYSNWETALQGAGITVRVISAIFARRVSWGQPFLYDPGLTQTEEGAAVKLFLSLALAVLALVLGWAVVRAKRWWLVLLFTLPPLLPGLLADLYPDWLPFMALASCWCVMLLTDLCKWSAPSGRGKLTLAVLPCVAAALGLITLMFPREGYTRPDWARNMEAEFYNGTSRMAEFFSRFDGPFTGRTTYVGSAEEADLTGAGPLNYTGRTVLRVRSDYEGRLYLRGSSLADYEDGVWRAMTDEVFQEAVQMGTGVPPRPLFFPAMSTEHGPEHTVTVDNVGAVGNCVYAPYFLTVQELEENGMTMVNDSLLGRRQGRWSHTLSFVELPEPHSSVQSGDVIIMLTDGQRGGADFGRYPHFVHDHYLDVPEEYREELAGFCLRNDIYGAYLDGRYASDPVDTAQQIAALLDQYYEYDQTVEAPPEGEDPVYYFLLESHRGYCMHFASAATLMLRSIGIPARYVSGFTVESVPGREAAVPDRAAHAWVEVWVGGFGWYPVEVTPAAAFEWYEEGIVGPEDFPSDPLEETAAPEPTPTPSQEPSVSEQPSAGVGESGSPENGPDLTALFAVLKALAVIAAVSALAWLGQYLPKKLRAKRLDNPDRNRAALDGYGYLKRMERWGGRVDQRAVELAQKARFSQHTLTKEELDELREFVDIERERLCIILDPLPRLAFRCLWGTPVRPKTGENAENNRENSG